MLVAAGLCPEVIMSLGSWDAYLERIRARFATVFDDVNQTLTEVPDGSIPVQGNGNLP